jgi:type VI secretion system secreted protein Hcp
MATDMFLEIEGIKGESTDHKHAGSIDVLAWSWGLSNSSTFHSGGGGGAGKSSFNDLSVTKHVDKSSPPLLYASASGKHLAKATLIVRKAGEKPLEYLLVKLTNVFVTSVHTGGSQGEERLTENITLNAQQVKVEYVPQDDKGGGGAAVPFGWDISKNVKI